MLRLLWIPLVLTGLLTGCAQTSPSSTPARSADSPLPRTYSDRLENAKDREQATCRSVTPLSAKNPMRQILFHCPSLNLEASLDEIKDSGWRLESIDIGQESSDDGTITMPLTIVIRKLF